MMCLGAKQHQGTKEETNIMKVKMMVSTMRDPSSCWSLVWKTGAGLRTGEEG